MKIKQALSFLTDMLSELELPQLEAELLLAACLKLDRHQLWMHPDKEINSEQLARLHAWATQRVQGVPLAYILGEKEFWSLTLKVNQHTLIPRPETELLVEIALEKLPRNERVHVLDLGTGSGAVAISLAKERPLWQIDAVDKSIEAIKVADENAKTHQLTNVSTMQSDWFANVTGQYQLIVSNPPYVEANFSGLSALQHEPISALVSGEDGLDDIRFIVSHASKHLTPSGWLLLEHGESQAAEVRKLLHSAGYASVETRKDLAGLPRVTVGLLS